MSKPIILAVYFDDSDAMGYPFDNPNYYRAYRGFSDRCAKDNITLVIVRGATSYLGKMVFQGGWKFAGDQLEKITQPITADVIYVKGKDLVTDATDYAVNQSGLAEICRDKLLTHQHFSQYMAPTYPIDASNWQAVVQTIATEKIVVKPRTGMEGQGILITPKQSFDYNQLDPDQAPYLAQDFIDSSAGIPGLVNGLHDLRLYIFNGVAKIAEYRQPKAGSFLANIAQGGSLTVVPLNQVPSWALEFVQHIDQVFQSFYPRIYTIDLMYANGKPYLVELNSRPGMPYVEWDYYDAMQQAILDTLLSNIKPA